MNNDASNKKISFCIKFVSILSIIKRKGYYFLGSNILKNNALHVPLLPFYHILESINMPVQLIASKKNIAKVLTNIYNKKAFNDCSSKHFIHSINNRSCRHWWFSS